MGGSIAVAFAEYFPQLIASLVLLSPGGLYDKLPAEYRALPVKYPWLFPSTYKKRFLRRLLNGPANSSKTTFRRVSIGPAPNEGEFGASQAAERVGSDVPIDVHGMVDWEIDHHQGFVYSITSSLSHAPTVRRHETWRRVGSYLSGNKTFTTVSGLPNRLLNSRVLLAIGENDAITPEAHLLPNVKETLGHDNVEVISFPGGHSFPMVDAQKLADAIFDFWKKSRQN